jgi:spore coat polysaccharide biosynthesis protein SpsF
MRHLSPEIVTVILSRNGSRRLPGKMTRTLVGTDVTVLDFILDRCKRLDTWPNVIVATSSSERDNSIEDIANIKGVRVYRGSESDVAGRFIKAAEKFNCKWAHRLNGDNLIFDYEAINNAMKKVSDNVDLISNVKNDHIPGLSIEIVRMLAVKNAYNLMSKDEREHILPKVYKLIPNNRLKWIDNIKIFNLGKVALDTQEDFSNLEGIIRKFKNITEASQASFAEIIKVHC